MVIQLDFVEKFLHCEGTLKESKQQQEVGAVKGAATVNSTRIIHKVCLSECDRTYQQINEPVILKHE